ncbi:redoxin family protein [Nonomuraea sp. NPDC049695]|uniref:peroxiredoxin family protein n=1 Tax=Nonomuraea sp. NPDC049695 TaxID=3154734 RepID=UPI00343BD503
MEYVVVALCLLGALVLLNLLLTLGLVRRMRHQDELIAETRHKGQHRSPSGLPNDVPVPEFATVTVEGQDLTRSWLTDGTTAVGFIAGDCPSCEAQLHAFVDLLKQRRKEENKSLVVLVEVPGMLPETEKELVGTFDGLATMTKESLGGTLQTAFRVRAYPAFFLIDAEGVVVSSGNTPDILLDGDPARP